VRAVGKLIGRGLPCAEAAGTAGSAGAGFVGTSSAATWRICQSFGAGFLGTAAAVALGGEGTPIDGSASVVAHAGRVRNPAPASHPAARRTRLVVATASSSTQSARTVPVAGP
jgi:hypothetical protein